MGCPGCNFSYCSKCLKKSIEVPRLNNKKHHVCLTCFDRIGKERSQPNPIPSQESPDSLPIDSPIPFDLPPIVDVQPTTNDSAPNANVDEAIKQRLTKLKEDRLQLENQTARVSDQDIAIRVANLKGERFVDTSNDRTVLLAVDNRSDQQKSNDLVAQFMSEAKLDEDADPIRDIERRLAALKGETDRERIVNPKADGGGIPDDSGSENDEDHVKRLVGRYLEEAALEPSGANDGVVLTAEEREFVESIPKAPDQQELPWCVICNEDATIRYEGDLFCRECYREVREDE